MAAIPPIEKGRVAHIARRTVLCELADHDQPLWLGVRQRPKQYGVDDAEDGGVCADSECQRDNGHGCEAGRLHEHAGGIPHITNEIDEGA